MELIEVRTKQEEKAFIEVNVSLNRDNPNYIRPLDKDIRDVFDPNKNKAFRFGTAKRWILKDEKGKQTVGDLLAEFQRTSGEKIEVSRFVRYQVGA